MSAAVHFLGRMLVAALLMVGGFLIGGKWGYRKALDDVEDDHQLRRETLERLAQLEHVRLEGHE